jgi:16S rRNA (cytidine1402-2'-O)-methyltransferase
MPGTLYVVATPIGNLEDITLRALRVLREVPLIAAEDTRRTSRLLSHYGIRTPTISFHEHNSRGRIPQLLGRLAAGTSVALVSDAGTPGISDPGVALVRACRERSIVVEPLPGACSALVAAVASGFPLEALTVLGFAPSRAHARSSWIQRLIQSENTTVFFESPHRAKRTLEEIRSVSGIRPICVGREMTKLHSEFVCGDTSTILSQLKVYRGELTFVLGPSPLSQAPALEQFPDLSPDEICQLPNHSKSRRASVARMAKKYGRTTNEMYSAIERGRKIRS